MDLWFNGDLIVTTLMTFHTHHVITCGTFVMASEGPTFLVTFCMCFDSLQVGDITWICYVGPWH